MHCLRVASVSDLPVIYGMQNVPLRERILNSPLPSMEQFVSDTARNMASSEFYFLHEEENHPIGFVHIRKREQSWEPTIWGKWLNTLIYGCAKTAFDCLGVSKLSWSVRKANQRALQCYQRHRFRMTGTGSVCNIQSGFQFVAIGPVIFFELTDPEYREREEYMLRCSFPIQFNW